jgi:hypothetical protein
MSMDERFAIDYINFNLKNLHSAFIHVYSAVVYLSLHNSAEIKKSYERGEREIFVTWRRGGKGGKEETRQIRAQLVVRQGYLQIHGLAPTQRRNQKGRSTAHSPSSHHTARTLNPSSLPPI